MICNMGKTDNIYTMKGIVSADGNEKNNYYKIKHDYPQKEGNDKY